MLPELESEAIIAFWHLPWRHERHRKLVYPAVEPLDEFSFKAHGVHSISSGVYSKTTTREGLISPTRRIGDVILDPFCGCGTIIAAAQKLSRRWIGIDITHLAISLIRHRMQDSFGKDGQFDVIGEPTSLQDAAALRRRNPYQFQWWALGLAAARPTEQKKGADRGIDGRLYFHDEGRNGKTKQIIFSVKSGTRHGVPDPRPRGRYQP